MAEPSMPSRTPISGRAIVVEVVLGLLGGVLLAPVAGFGGSWIVDLLVPDLGMGLLIVQIFLALLGFVAGVAAGVSLGGRLMRQGGSWWLSLVGAVIAGVLVLVLLATGLFDGAEQLIVVLAPTLSLGLAVLGYNLRRRLQNQ